jgi:hypothetical protein
MFDSKMSRSLGTSDTTSPASPNPFRTLSLSRQSKNKAQELKTLRFTIRNNIQVHTANHAQITAFIELMDQAIGKKAQTISGMGLAHLRV